MITLGESIIVTGATAAMAVLVVSETLSLRGWVTPIQQPGSLRHPVGQPLP